MTIGIAAHGSVDCPPTYADTWATSAAIEMSSQANAPAAVLLRAPDFYSGGETTVFETGAEAFSLSARNLTHADRRAFFIGNSFFTENWVSAPASTTGRDGLGPLFNAVSCSSCHFKDGRGAPPLPGEPAVSLLFRFSVPDEHGIMHEEPHYGSQFQNHANPGIAPEGEVRIDYGERPGIYPDGTPYSLRHPTYRLTKLAYGPMSTGTLVSARVAPALIGLGLLEAIPEADIVRHSDLYDRDQDGVSGRPNRVFEVRNKWTMLGRFGWKANQPTLEQQNATAFVNDLGITSDLFPEHPYTPIQKAALSAPNGGTPELDADKLSTVTQYTRMLAVPGRRNANDPDIRAGEALFHRIQCTTCHVDTFRTGPNAALAALANQTIHPYTDLLLHDMGEALSDNRPDGAATGQEWRTPPLWGIGLVKAVNRHTNFLHDGRARSIEEAILWHDGEGAPARRLFMRLSAGQRDKVLKFLDSL